MTQPSCPVMVVLVSDQSMPNVLPALALKPARVLRIVSDLGNPRFSESADRIRDTVVRAGRKISDFQFSSEWPESVDLGSPNPSIESTRIAVSEALKAFPGAIVNYTGGTKNMSIGAWLAAEEGGVARLYCDTPREFLVEGGAGIVSGVSLPETAGKFTAELILRSQGLHRGRDWDDKVVSGSQVELGKIAFEIGAESGEAFRKYRHRLLVHGLPDNGHLRPHNIDRVLGTPVPDPPRPEFLPFLETAREAGLLEEREGRFFYKVRKNARVPRKVVVKRIEQVAQGLTGAAFEGYVADAIHQGDRFSSFLANVYPAGGNPEDKGFGETDFIAYEPKTVALTLISCKSSPPKLEHLESLLSRKSRFGGLYANTLLCVEYAGNSERERLLRSHCSTLGIQCAIGEEVNEALGHRRLPSAYELLQLAFDETGEEEPGRA